MNGFTNAVLTLLLGWLRSLFNAVWAALSSDGNGALVSFLRSQWKTVLIVLCVGGFVIDRIVYLFRWRPYYVWRSRRKSRAARGNAAPDAFAAPPAPVQNSDDVRPSEPRQDEYEEPTQMYRPPLHAASSPGFAPAYRYTAPAAGTVRQVPPAYSSSLPYEDEAASVLPYQRPETYVPPAPEPMDDTIAYSGSTDPMAPAKFPDEIADLSEWDAPQGGFQDFAPRVAAVPTPPSQPAASPSVPAEPGRMRRVSRLQNEQYLNDVRSGFAPPPTPEDLYASPEEPVWDGPIHPGLDLETFQQNIGLNQDELSGEYDERDDMSAYPNFAPFTAATQDSSADKAGKLGAFAKKARIFMRGEDENNPPSIRDLQSTVDVGNAFHAPVYPKKPPESGEE
jgi:hypothetical protein